MRLFIAIDLNEEIKDNLIRIILQLKNKSLRGSYTRRENLHITLVFLGEVEKSKINLIEQAMNEVKAVSFKMSLRGFGCFRRKEGDIYWIGINQNEKLNDIYQQLHMQLTRAGFVLENRPFKPHLTVGRRIVTGPSFDANAFDQLIPPMNMDISKISLMKSEQIDGKLTYTEIYARNI
ncbi:MAG TPA: RNA 2',3'-cyclic phosphodiesterase [Syntrophomonadaceae bacterium]|nr:RNA 2',3'-cyclic phosphodiesterase [Syntrophomonadaceae bacterium]HPR93002.1 RNA 2',3'-cyclic phosphodiesterase [Syntrophomonadaceae bacterium]